MGISTLFSDPMAFLIRLLITLPGVLIALSVHEAAHGYVALKCGDPTAKRMGRVTLNPLRHIDIVGFLCMIFVGFGWAKPVPVNPYNFRNSRRDDLRVSLAGITANLIMCLLGVAALFTMFLCALARQDMSVVMLRFCYYNESWQLTLRDLFVHFRSNDAINILIFESFGEVVGYLYVGVIVFTNLNLMLAVFNLLPIPPLDGYHVLNDLVLKRPLFAPAQAARIGTGILFALIMLGNFVPGLDIISRVFSFMQSIVFDSIAKGVYWVYALIA